jgi:hypothetical protein
MSDYASDPAEACAAALLEPPLAFVGPLLPPALRHPAGCFSALAGITGALESADSVRQFASQVAEPHTFERWLLLQAALHAIPQLDTLLLPEGVKAFWRDDVLFYAKPPEMWLDTFSLDHVRFREMARLVTFRRFPAGQFHWEISGIPRSFLLRTSPGNLPALSAFLLRHVRALRPYAETHVNDRRKNRLTLTQSEGMRSYHLLAQTLRLQPTLRGLFTAGWMYCRSTRTVSPRLAWMRYFLVENGALLAPMGPAPADSGFLIGSAERRQLYEQGRYRPQMTYVIWPRKAILDWAQRYEAECSQMERTGSS